MDRSNSSRSSNSPLNSPRSRDEVSPAASEASNTSSNNSGNASVNSDASHPIPSESGDLVEAGSSGTGLGGAALGFANKKQALLEYLKQDVSSDEKADAILVLARDRSVPFGVRWPFVKENWGSLDISNEKKAEGYLAIIGTKWGDAEHSCNKESVQDMYDDVVWEALTACWDLDIPNRKKAEAALACVGNENVSAHSKRCALGKYLDLDISGEEAREKRVDTFVRFFIKEAKSDVQASMAALESCKRSKMTDAEKAAGLSGVLGLVDIDIDVRLHALRYLSLLGSHNELVIEQAESILNDDATANDRNRLDALRVICKVETSDTKKAKKLVAFVEEQELDSFFKVDALKLLSELGGYEDKLGVCLLPIIQDTKARGEDRKNAVFAYLKLKVSDDKKADAILAFVTDMKVPARRKESLIKNHLVRLNISDDKKADGLLAWLSDKAVSSNNRLLSLNKCLELELTKEKKVEVVDAYLSSDTSKPLQLLSDVAKAGGCDDIVADKILELLRGNVLKNEKVNALSMYRGLQCSNEKKAAALFVFADEPSELVKIMALSELRALGGYNEKILERWVQIITDKNVTSGGRANALSQYLLDAPDKDKVTLLLKLIDPSEDLNIRLQALIGLSGIAGQEEAARAGLLAILQGKEGANAKMQALQPYLGLEASEDERAKVLLELSNENDSYLKFHVLELLAEMGGHNDAIAEKLPALIKNESFDYASKQRVMTLYMAVESNDEKKAELFLTLTDDVTDGSMISVKLHALFLLGELGNRGDIVSKKLLAMVSHTGLFHEARAQALRHYLGLGGISKREKGRDAP